MPYHFFFSYARLETKTKDGLLDKFFNDLKNEVSTATGDWDSKDAGGDPPDDDGMRPGFRDDRIDEGEWWELKLDRALRTSRTFIGVCSPTYIRRDWCGREWQYFRTRVQEYHAQHVELPEPPALMIPVNWVPIPSPPEVLRVLQKAHQNLGEYYAERGLRKVMIDKPKDKDSEYQVIVGKIAERIVDVSGKCLLPNWTEVQQLKDVTSAFPAHAGGPRVAQFVYLVGRGDEVSADGRRTQTSSYGESPEFWKPYDPPDTARAARVAWDAAAKLNHDYYKLEPDDQLADAILKARDRRRLVVLMVDPWTLRVARYKNMIAALKTEVSAFPVVRALERSGRGHKEDRRRTPQGPL